MVVKGFDGVVSASEEGIVLSVDFGVDVTLTDPSLVPFIITALVSEELTTCWLVTCSSRA